MNDVMTQPHDSLLSQTYREASHPEPSPDLDARILTAARQAVLPHRRRPRWLSWAVPLSTMTILVLGIGLLFRMQLESPEAIREDMPSLEALHSVPVAKQEARLSKPATPDSTTHSGAREVSPNQTQALNTAEVEVDATANSIAPSPAPGPGEKSMDVASESDALPMLKAGEGAASISESRPAARIGTDSISAGSMNRSRDTSTEMTPEQWLESIRHLVRQGRIEEARESLKVLHKQYPDFSLPDDIKACCVSK